MTPRTFVLTIDRQINRFDETVKHLDIEGIEWERFDGFDNQRCRLNSKDTFDLDRAGERLEAKHVAATLTHWAAWKVAWYSSEDSWWFLEFDVRMVPDWSEQYERAMSVMPDDWQVIFLGSCCCKGRETTHVSENVYEVKYPLCGHAIQIRRSALPTLLHEHQKINMPLDIALYHNSLPKLRTYCILPRIIEQHNTHLPE
jgi:hypothetical protein